MSRQTANIIFVGHHGCGKSTVAGHLVKICGGISDQKFAESKQSSFDLGRPYSVHAWAFDNHPAERERGLTLETNYRKFESQGCRYTLIDTPGAQDYVNSVVYAASQADIALLVISAAPGEYEAGMEGGMTKEQALICFTMGVKQILVVVTKMDMAQYSKERYEDIKKTVAPYLKKVGYKDEVSFVPLAGFKGHGISDSSSDLNWYTGPPLLGVINALGQINRPPEKPLRIPISKVHEVRDEGTVPVGRVETGTLRCGIKVQFSPGGYFAEVKSVEVHGEATNEAQPGDIVGFCIGDDVERRKLRRGVVASMSNDPACEAETFLAQVIVLSHPGAIKAGYCPVMNVHTAQVPCEFESLISKIDRKTGKEAEKNPAQLKSGDVAMVLMRPLAPVVVETFAAYPSLGRFAVRDHGQTIAVGVIKEVTKRPFYKAKSEKDNTYFDR